MFTQVRLNPSIPLKSKSALNDLFSRSTISPAPNQNEKPSPYIVSKDTGSCQIKTLKLPPVNVNIGHLAPLSSNSPSPKLLGDLNSQVCKLPLLRVKRGKILPVTSESFIPQVGKSPDLSVSDMVTFLTSSLEHTVSDDIISRLEDFIFLIYNLKNATSLTSMSVTVLSFIKTYLTGSVLKNARTSIENIFASMKNLEESLHVQSGDSEDDETTFMDSFRRTYTDWKIAKNNKFSVHISNLLSVLVALGLIDSKVQDFSIGGVEFFYKDLFSVHNKACNVFDAIFSTVIFFVEGAHNYFYKTHRLSSFFQGASQMTDMEDDFMKCESMWINFRNGNHIKAGFSEHSFVLLLNKTIDSYGRLAKSLSGPSKLVAQNSATRLNKILSSYKVNKLHEGLREAPIGILLCGASSQGKTTFGQLMVQGLLVSQGLETGPEYRGNINPNDKFLSDWKTHKLVAIVDDIANMHKDYVGIPPTQLIIDLINNVTSYANMADVDAKGQVLLMPLIVLLTSNIKNMKADSFSNCPQSIQRRVITVVVKVKPEYCNPLDGTLDKSKVLSRDTTLEKNGIPNIWNISFETAVKPVKQSSLCEYEPTIANGKEMTNIPAQEAIQYMIEQFRIHRIQQKKILAQEGSMRSQFQVCPHTCKEGDHEVPCVGLEGMCVIHDGHPDPLDSDTISLPAQLGEDEELEEHVERVPPDSAYYREDEAVTHLPINCAPSILSRVVSYVINKHTPTFGNYTNRELYGMLSSSIWPATLLRNPFVQISATHSATKIANPPRHSYYTTMNVIILMLLTFTCPPLAIIYVTYLFLAYAFLIIVTRRHYLEVISSRRGVLELIVEDQRVRNAAILCATSVLVTVMYKIAKTFKKQPKMMDYFSQSVLNPTTDEEVIEVNKRQNFYEHISTPRFVQPASERSVTSDLSAAYKSIRKNQVYVSMGEGSPKYIGNILFLCSNVFLMPNHYFTPYKDGIVKMTCTHNTGRGDISPTSKIEADIANSYLVPDSDLRVCYTSMGGSHGSILEFFPDALLSAHNALFFHTGKDGSITSCNTKVQPSYELKKNNCLFDVGSVYELEYKTFKGLCGAVLLSRGSAKCISGIHLAGNDFKGASGFVTRGILADAIKYLNGLPSVAITGSAGEFSSMQFGEQMLNRKPTDPKSPLIRDSEGEFKYIVNSCNEPVTTLSYKLHGSCTGKVTSYSSYQPTIISDYVTQVFGQTNVYGGPAFKPSYAPKMKCLTNMNFHAKNFPGRLLQIAVADYAESLFQRIEEVPSWKKMCPLDHNQTLNGIPGCKYIDNMNFKSSIGHPLTGSKDSYTIDLEPTEDYPRKRDFLPIINDELERVGNLYAQGLRAYVPSKACKKDEVLVYKKRKCRIFFANGIALVYWLRRLYLPLIRFLQFNPILAETAVGVNCHGTDWSELMEAIEKFGTSQFIAGDYSKYDQRLPAQLIIASLSILVDVAKMCDYSPKDITMMRAMIGDISYSVIAFEGDMIELMGGTHISGNSLTVITNSICGSLNLRCAFYNAFPPDNFRKRKKFRDYVSLMTYGDDNIGSVSREVSDKFNIVVIASFLESYGQIYTMPDKESELIPLMDSDRDSIEFLKRVDVYHPKLGYRLGALIEPSIFKFLQGCLKPHDVEQHGQDMLNTSLMEWFNHGEDVYEQRRKQVKEVVTLAGWDNLVTGVTLSYDDRVEIWKTKNLDQDK